MTIKIQPDTTRLALSNLDSDYAKSFNSATTDDGRAFVLIQQITFLRIRLQSAEAALDELKEYR